MSERIKFNPEAGKRVDLNQWLGYIDQSPIELSSAIFSRVVDKL